MKFEIYSDNSDIFSQDDWTIWLLKEYPFLKKYGFEKEITITKIPNRSIDIQVVRTHAYVNIYSLTELKEIGELSSSHLELHVFSDYPLIVIKDNWKGTGDEE